MAVFRLPRVRRRFAEFLREQRPAVVLCTMNHVWNPLMLRMIRRSAARFLLVLHDALPHPGESFASLRRYLIGRELAAADGVIVLSEHVGEVLRDVYAFPGQRCWVVPHGAFGYAATDRERDLPVDRPLNLLFFGRILRYKGLDLLLDAYRILRSERPNLALRIVGEGDLSPYRAKLDRLSGVTIENAWVPEQAIGSVFDRADIVVAPYIEASQSGVIPMALAAGLPVVVTPVGGLVEQVSHMRTGIVAELADPAAVADAVRTLVTDRTLYRQCSRQALHVAKRTMDWSEIARAIASLVSTVAAMPPRTA